MLRRQIPGFFKARREKLMKDHPGAAFIFPAAPEVLRNPDVHFPFRQESSFFYLTAFEEPESCLLLTASGRTILFVRERDPEKEMWEGERYGTQGALDTFSVHEAYSIHDLDKKLPELLKGSEKVYYRLGEETMDRKILAALETYRRSQGRSGKALVPVLDPNEAVGEMRLFKSPEEAEFLRKAGKISAHAHTVAMKAARPGMNEFEVEALIDYELRKGGCQRVGYGSIVAGGKNATCLHYRSNNEVLKDGDLLLIDAGGEFEYYTADITRTFPVGKTFSPAQIKIYDLVLKSQMDAIAMAKPGTTMVDIHKKVCDVLTEGLLSLGLLSGKREDLVKDGGFRRFFPHGTGHWLGMDVHDVGLYKHGEEPRKLEVGMCFTIEPGLYIQPWDKEAAAEYNGIGIRIEDDILITANGCEILTRDVPKTRADIEKLKA